MKAVVCQGVNELQVKDVAEPLIENPTDAIIKVNLSTICGGDIHLKASEAIKPGKIIGHEYCGEILDVGAQVSNLKMGDRVIGRHELVTCGQFHSASLHDDISQPYLE